MDHYYKALTFAALLFAGTAATGQTQPEIAYASTASGGRAVVYLTNRTGTSRSLVYRGDPGSEIHHVDIRPGGGELAIEEHKPSPSLRETASVIKIIKYEANGSLIGSIRTLKLSCRTGSLDYHPDDGTLLYRDCSTPKRIRRLNTTTWLHTDLGLLHPAFIASWRDATRILYWTTSADVNYADRKFWTVSTADLNDPTEVLAHPSPGSLDTSTSGNMGLSSYGSEWMNLLQITPSPQINEFMNGAGRGHFSPDDLHVAYITRPNPNQYVLIRRFDGAGSLTVVGGAGIYTALDWRN